MDTITLKARVGPDHQLVWVDPLPLLKEGEVKVTLHYPTKAARKAARAVPALPVLDGKRYLGGMIRREEIYDDAR
jgi:hypothetical protein